MSKKSPAKKPAAAKKAAPAKPTKAAPVKKAAAPAKPVTPAKSATSAKPSAPAKSAAPAKPAAKPTAAEPKADAKKGKAMSAADLKRMILERKSAGPAKSISFSLDEVVEIAKKNEKTTDSPEKSAKVKAAEAKKHHDHAKVEKPTSPTT